MATDKEFVKPKNIKKILILISLIIILATAAVIYYFNKGDKNFCIRDSECNFLDANSNPYDTPFNNFCRNFTCQTNYCQADNDCQESCEGLANDLKVKGHAIPIIGTSCLNNACSCMFKSPI